MLILFSALWGYHLLHSAILEVDFIKFTEVYDRTLDILNQFGKIIAFSVSIIQGVFLYCAVFSGSNNFNA